MSRMANATWRVLEEQRMNALEAIDEANTEIERWSAKRADAMRALAMCEAGQKGSES
jgi:hypothetical protein